jgi:hypothetical protein
VSPGYLKWLLPKQYAPEGALKKCSERKKIREKAKHYWGISPNIHIMTTPKILDKRLHVKFYIQKINYVSGVKKQIWVIKIIVRSSIFVYYA